jgi:hypothetical protein
MEKILSVSTMPQGSGYVPHIRIAGKYLENFDFTLDSKVIVTVTKGKITIRKATKNKVFQFLCRKHPSLQTLSDALKLNPASFDTVI